MSCKKPILLAIDGVSKDLVNDAECGVYVEPENPEAIAKGIQHFLSLSNSQRQHMGGKGYHYAKQHFDRKILAIKYIKHIKAL
jgi:glycosyltransferase involved in cell wall biosynthesis